MSRLLRVVKNHDGDQEVLVTISGVLSFVVFIVAFCGFMYGVKYTGDAQGARVAQNSAELQQLAVGLHTATGRLTQIQMELREVKEMVRDISK